jgi:arylsulfatase A-like enzyme
VPEGWLGSHLGADPTEHALRVAQLGEAGVAVRHDALKLIDLLPAPSLFDLSNDAREQHDLADTRPDAVARLMQTWADFRSSLALPGITADQAAPMDPETQRALQELGYIDER